MVVFGNLMGRGDEGRGRIPSQDLERAREGRGGLRMGGSNRSRSPGGGAVDMIWAMMPHPAVRSSVPTPALVIDLTALEGNIVAMAAKAAGWGVSLRPHAKSHKCVAIAARQ